MVYQPLERRIVSGPRDRVELEKVLGLCHRNIPSTVGVRATTDEKRHEYVLLTTLIIICGNSASFSAAVLK